MKKLVIAIGLGLMAGSAYAACIGGDALCYGDGKVTINGVYYIDGNGQGGLVKTIAQINASTPTVAGQEVKCSDCGIAYSTCVSTKTGTSLNAFILSTGTLCK